jgi:voltage-gated potassium channel
MDMKTVRRRLQIFFALFFLIAISGTFGFMVLEDLTFAEAFYYNIVTMSTVGYGDIHPTKQASRMFAIFLIIMGGATFLGVIANATEILLLKREKQSRLRKVNMVLGVFFSEVGHELLSLFSRHDHHIEKIRDHLLVNFSWTENHFSTALNLIKKHDLRVDMDKVPLETIFKFLKTKRKFFIGLLENPALIEQESFSEVLLAVFHLTDELSCRDNLTNLPASDKNHLSGDINRAYKKLIEQWFIYLKHLKAQYPYLYSLAVRKNPFNPKANPVVLPDKGGD